MVNLEFKPALTSMLREHSSQNKNTLHETAWPVKVKLQMKHQGGTNVFINDPGHMTKMAA